MRAITGDQDMPELYIEDNIFTQHDTNILKNLVKQSIWSNLNTNSVKEQWRGIDVDVEKEKEEE